MTRQRILRIVDYLIVVLVTLMSIPILVGSMVYLGLISPHHKPSDLVPWWYGQMVATSLGVACGSTQAMYGIIIWIVKAFDSRRIVTSSYTLGVFFLMSIIAFSVSIHFKALTNYSFRFKGSYNGGLFFVTACGLNWTFCATAIIVFKLLKKYLKKPDTDSVDSNEYYEEEE